MASEGPYLPDDAYSSGATGISWSQPLDVTVQDTFMASISAPSSSFVDDLIGYQFGFAIPTDATIDGILVEAHSLDYTTGNPTTDLYLTKDAVTAATVAKPISPGAGWQSIGGTSDLWGASWTPAEINSADFGVILGSVYDQFNSWGVEIDAIRVTVYYTEANLQHAYPDADIDDAGWTASSGTDLYAMLDETSASDTDYIEDDAV